MSADATWGFKAFGGKTCHEIMQSNFCSVNCFAGTIQVINGALECTGASNVAKTNGRIDYYSHVGKILDVPEFKDKYNISNQIKQCLKNTCMAKKFTKCGGINLGKTPKVDTVFKETSVSKENLNSKIDKELEYIDSVLDSISTKIVDNKIASENIVDNDIASENIFDNGVENIVDNEVENIVDNGVENIVDNGVENIVDNNVVNKSTLTKVVSNLQTSKPLKNIIKDIKPDNISQDNLENVVSTIKQEITSGENITTEDLEKLKILVSMIKQKKEKLSQDESPVIIQQTDYTFYIIVIILIIVGLIVGGLIYSQKIEKRK